METVLSGNQWSITKRPQKLDEVFGQDKIVKQFKNILSSGKSIPNALWFEGRYGCGKTTIAKIIAKTIQCRNKDADGNPCNQCVSCKSIENETFGRNTIMFNAGANGLVDPVRELINQTNYPPMMDGNWVIMIEEAQKLVDGAVQALLKTVEVPRSNVYFIFTSMEEDQSVFEMKSMKNFKALKSRCRPFHVASASVADLMLYMRNKVLIPVLKEDPALAEKLPDNFDDIIQSIANHCNGSYRTAIQTLEEVIDAEAFTAEDLTEMFGIVDDKNILNSLLDIMDGKATDIIESTFISGSNDARKTNFNEAFNKVASAKILKTFKPTDSSNPYIAQIAKLAAHRNLEIAYKGLSEIIEYCGRNYFDHYYCGAKICDLINACKSVPVSISSFTTVKEPLTESTEPSRPLARMVTEPVVVNETAPATVIQPTTPETQITRTDQSAVPQPRQTRQFAQRPVTTTSTPQPRQRNIPN